MKHHDAVCGKLAAAGTVLAQLKSETLKRLKSRYKDLKRDDFLWHYILQSFATWGGSSGWKGLIDTAETYDQITFDAVRKWPASKRTQRASRIFATAKVRYANDKGRHLVGCFDHINELGGLVAARDMLLQQKGREAKIRFLKAFPGIGDKYARNIMMDVYHPDFRNSIAIDSRIKKISNEWKLTFRSYSEHEAFYLEVARTASLSGWELDRLMYRFETVFYPPINPKI